MLPFNQYITGKSETVAVEELDRLLNKYPWFTTARRVRQLVTEASDPELILPLMASPTVAPSLCVPRESSMPPPTASHEESIIGRFLEVGGYRIVPQETDTPLEVEQVEFFVTDENPEILTEELAEIYLAQGLADQAREIYRKLSLLNPEKCIYFADIIKRIDAETTNN